MRIPAPDATTVELRVAGLVERDRFGQRWRYWPLLPCGEGFWEIDIGGLGLADGTYEYEFVLDGDRERPVPDPYATEITRFGGYRGLFHIRAGRPWSPPFDWSDELPPGVALPENNRIIVYEMPLRWMEGDTSRQVGLGTFEKVVFAHLDRLARSGVNCIELLPIQDSPDTLNWGYGTRFFFAPDLDMGTPLDLKWFVKRCHQFGVRVFLDVVMNHARECPLARLAWRRYFIDRPADEPGRGEDYGGQMFRYREAVDGRHWARLLHLDMARYWIAEYHIDGFRIDEFRGIDHWEFVQEFRDAAWTAFRQRFPDRPFLVVAEDSWTRTRICADAPGNPNGRKVVDAMWNFSFRDEIRRLLLDDLHTAWGQPARRDRIAALISGRRRWDELSQRFESGYGDLAQSVGYVTSHDVERDGERRFLNHVLASLLRYFGHGDGSFQQVRDVVDAVRTGRADPELVGLHRHALERVRSAYALLLTSVTIPMLLAGEEFGDIHDTNHYDWQLKMSDPVDWYRRDDHAHRETAAAVSDLMWLRQGHPALHRNEVEFFYFHPTIDEPRGRRVFAYCRTAGQPLGSGGQVVVIANMGGDDYATYRIPWHWLRGWTERGGRPGIAPLRAFGDGSAVLSLAPFEARVFETY